VHWFGCRHKEIRFALRESVIEVHSGALHDLFGQRARAQSIAIVKRCNIHKKQM
jgi:hypothetical protein